MQKYENIKFNGSNSLRLYSTSQVAIVYMADNFCMDFPFDLSLDFIRGTHLIGSYFPRWRPKSKMAAITIGIVIYLVVNVRYSQ